MGFYTVTTACETWLFQDYLLLLKRFALIRHVGYTNKSFFSLFQSAMHTTFLPD